MAIPILKADPIPEAWKVCKGCGTAKPETDFPIHRGLRRHLQCKACRNSKYDRRIRKGTKRAMEFRNGRKQASNELKARWRVETAIRNGLIPRAGSKPCADCGGMPEFGDKEGNHEYDHIAGYDPKHWLTVEEVCKRCHHERTIKRLPDA